MITALDSSVLLDVLVEGSPQAGRSYSALDKARSAGRVVACPVVWAEVRAVFERQGDMDLLTDAGIEFDPFDRETRRPPVSFGGCTVVRVVAERD